MANRIGAALLGGAAGALTLTALHQILKRVTPDAPRADNLAKQGLRKAFHAAGATPPSDDKLHWASLAGDLAANTAYYSAGLAFGPRVASWLGPLLGAGAGVGVLTLPGPMGLDPAETNRTRTTQMLAFGLYLAGSVAATATYRALLHEHDANRLLADIPA
jgi:hypothetical protein